MIPKLPKAVRGLVDGKNFAFLATLMVDGSPQVTPVWVDREDGVVIINTVKGRTKQRNIDRDSRVALAVVDWKNPYTWAQIRGRVVEQTTKDARNHIDKLAKKYMNLEKYPWGDTRRMIVKIIPEHVVWEKG